MSRYANTEDVRWWSSDKTVSADLVVFDGGATIYVFNSFFPGAGNARKALKELRRQYGFVAAYGVGTSPRDPSWQFWKKMKKENLIDEMYDDYGNKV